MKYLIIIISFILISCNCKSLNADYDYFNINEFRCGNNQEAIWVAENVCKPKLNTIRKTYNKPMYLTNGYNTNSGQVDSSDHRYRKNPMRAGVDVAIHNGNERFLLTKSCMLNNICRIGIANSFIHIGFTKVNNPQNVIWLYGEDL